MFKTNLKLVKHAAGDLFWSFEFGFFEIVSDFDIRYSDLLSDINAEYLAENRRILYTAICRGTP